MWKRRQRTGRNTVSSWTYLQASCTGWIPPQISRLNLDSLKLLLDGWARHAQGKTSGTASKDDIRAFAQVANAPK